MQITVTTESGNVYPFEVNLELTLQDLKAILEIEVTMNASQMILLHNMDPMIEEGRSLKDYHVQEGDIIMLRPTSPSHTPSPTHATNGRSAPLSQQSVATDSDHGATGGSRTPPQGPIEVDPHHPDVIRRHLLSHPAELALLRQRNPPLAHALDSGDQQVFRDALECYRRRVAEVERQRIRMLNADPLDPTVQARIAQEIQQRNIQENMETAIEFTPESFGRVVMLYIPIKVNGVLVYALVDSGAASTVMSETCAERCGVMRLVDRRFATVAVGVGTQKVIGKVHLGTVQIGDDMLTTAFQVLQNQSEDMLLGLDMLRRHQCCIDLKKNVLRIGTTGTEASFLTEADLKDKEMVSQAKKQKLVMEDEDAEIARVLARSEQDHASDQETSSALHSHAVQQPGPSPSHSTVQQQVRSWPSHSQPAMQPHPSSSSTQQQQSAPSSASVTTEVPPRSQVPESSILQVMSAGFSREQAIKALELCEGNTELALGSLFSM